MDETGFPARLLIGWFWRNYARHAVPWMALASVFMVLEGAALGGLSYMVRPMFDQVFIGGDRAAVYWVAGIVAGIFLGRGISGYLKRILMGLASRKLMIKLKTEMVDHMLRLDSAFFLKHSPGKLMERVNGDTSAAIGIVSSTFTSVGRDVTAIVSLLFVAVTTDWLWTLVALAGAPLIVVPVVMIQRRLRRLARRVRNIAGRVTMRLDEMFHGIDTIKLNAIEDRESRRYRMMVRNLARETMKATATQAAVPALLDIVAAIGFAGVLVFGGLQIIEGEKTVGDFMAFFTAIGLLFEPMRRLGGLSGGWQRALVSMERIYAVFQQQPRITSPARPVPLPADMSRADIRLEDVRFSYGDTLVLDGVSFVAEAGKTTAIVGPSGAGKTTVFKLLARLADPDTGRILLGDHALPEYDLADLRRAISVVTQDTLLFDESLRRNVVLAAEPSEEDLRAALDAANVSQFLDNLAAGIDTEVGPRGAALSGGQRQRVAIARAILRDTPILLLDEATSALDSESEKLVQQAIDGLSRNRTTLVIAHRLSTVRNAARIVVMDQGRVVEQGTHDELLAAGGTYARLHDLQFTQADPA